MTRCAVLFDLDGTLVDTAPDLCAVLTALLSRHSRPPLPYAVARNEVSNGAIGMIRTAFADARSEEEIERLRLDFLEIYLEGVCINSRIFSGLDDILQRLEELRYPWGIVTNKPHAMTEPLLQALGLDSRPACVISGDRLPVRKPHPAPLRLAAEEIGFDPAQCVYVGDAQRDIEAGRAAGMATIAAAYGYIRQNEDPVDWGADLVIRHPDELLAACTQVFGVSQGADRARG
ncbi:MAG: HAD-IA family hydrolase [Gammaproteobacteria bacterium]|nr:HAD-IA family hydrolase [Gammaproteobacteria bacterium]